MQNLENTFAMLNNRRLFDSLDDSSSDASTFGTNMNINTDATKAIPPTNQKGKPKPPIE